MNCPNCGNEMIWGSDFTFDDYGLDGSGIVANYTCPVCGTYVEIYTPLEDE